MTEDEKRALARRRVAQLEGYYAHVAVFVLVMALLVTVNALGTGRWWVQWVALGWGIGLLAHTIAIYGRRSRLVTRWEERKVDELVRRM